MKVYISGKISGTKDFKERFAKAKKEVLDGIDKDCEIFNPADVEVEGWSWSDYMKFDLCHLLCSDAIFMLKGWRRSKGARLERRIAKKVGIAVIYQ